MTAAQVVLRNIGETGRNLTAHESHVLNIAQRYDAGDAYGIEGITELKESNLQDFGLYEFMMDQLSGCGDACPNHEYAQITCPKCGHDGQCWGCSVRVTDDSSGDGIFTCHFCGRSAEYVNSEVVI